MKTFFLGQNEKGGSSLLGKLPTMPTSESRASTSNRPVEYITHSRMEVGSDFS